MPDYPPAIAKQMKGYGQGGDNSLSLESVWNKISEKNIIDFTRGLAVMLRANIPLVKALDTVINQTDKKRLKQILQDVRKDVKGGKSLAKSLSKHENTFDKLYINLVEIGELAGILDKILFRLSGYMEKRHKLKQKVRMAMVYPSLVIAVAFGAMFFLLVFIVPTFAEMYNSFNAELPQATQVVLSISQFITDYFLYGFIGITGSVLGLRAYLQKPKGRYLMDSFKLRIPFWSPLYRKTLMTRFCQTLGTLLKSGITLTDALKILKEASGNMLMKDNIEQMLKSVKKGGSLKKSLEQSKVFPGMVIQMVTVGEETAELDEMLLHIAALYEDEVDIAVEGLTSVIEPVLIVILGIMLGSIIIAMYLPIFELMNVIQ